MDATVVRRPDAGVAPGADAPSIVVPRVSRNRTFLADGGALAQPCCMDG